MLAAELGDRLAPTQRREHQLALLLRAELPVLPGASTSSLFCCALNFRYFLVSLNVSPDSVEQPIL